MRVQLRDPQGTGVVLPPVTIVVDPEFKGKDWKNEVVAGRNNFVLLHKADDQDSLSEAFGIKGMPFT